MALIGKIRRNSWILILFIGLGLAAFIMMDMFSQKGPGGGAPTDIASVNGEAIDYRKFNLAEQIRYRGSGGNTFGQRESLWNYFVEESLLKQEGKKLGLAVGKEELMELQFGNKLSPVIQNTFRGANGQVDRNLLNSYKQQIEERTLETNNPVAYQYWFQQEDMIIKDRLQSKLTSMVSKGMYTPSWMAESLASERGQNLDFNYVRIPFSDVADSEVNVTDADLSAYLNENSALYKADQEQRLIEYISFNVFPTREDSVAIRNDLSNMKTEFQNTRNDSTFVVERSGVYPATFSKKATLSAAVADKAYSMPVGTVIGPYVDGDSYRMAKVLDKRVIADSVKAQHILFAVDATNPATMGPALARADSVLNLITQQGQSFATLAEQFSDDKSNHTKGGDLGYFAEGTMVPEFNNAVFYEMQPGETKTVITQFGVHVLKLNDKKVLNNEPSVKVAYISRSIIPSENTQAALEEKAQNFVNENTTIDALKTLADSDPSLELVTAPAVTANDYIVGGLGQDASSRELVRWAFEKKTDVGDLSPNIFTYTFSNPRTFENHNSKFVVAALKKVQGAGTPTVDMVRSEIMPLVMNQKKAALIKSAITGKGMSAIASQYDTQVDSLAAVSTASAFIPGLGSEPKVLAAAQFLEQNQVSAPIVGDNGVYILEVTNKTATGVTPNVAQLKKEEASRLSTMARQNLMNAMRKSADIEDNRYNFF